MKADTVDLLTTKGRIPTEQALVIAEAMDMAIRDAQLVTVPILDARFLEAGSRVDDRFAEVNQRFAEADAKVEKRFAEVNQRFVEADARMEKRFAETDAKMVKGFAEADAKMVKGFAEADAKMAKGFAEADAKMAKGFAEAGAKMEKGFAEVKAGMRELRLWGYILVMVMIGSAATGPLGKAALEVLKRVF